ncbi:MAG: alpha/beta hydrolase, partial [Candidatus Hydrogenedentes bacterium]|nr:alpha/beta hydrolase [Candidatus Hydrogenedentota bacterium]
MKGTLAVKVFLPAFFLGLAVASPAFAQQTDLPYTREINVVYDEVHGTGLVADIFRPTGTPNGLGIIDVVCGAWHSDRGKLRDHEAGQVFNIFTRRGYVVFGMRPGSVTKYSGHELAEHVRSSIRWVKAHAAEYGVDPNRIGMMGASAGGHLALLASVTPEEAKPDAKEDVDRVDTRVKAVSVFFPPTDFVDWGGKKPDYSRTIGNLLFTGGVGDRSQEEIDAKARELSPRYRVTAGALPPYMIYHGDADPM